MNRGVLATAVVLSFGALGALTGCADSTPAAERWVCTWDPTMNHDWHDDYLCTKGSLTHRPRLLPGDSFVERSEIDKAAAAYEAQLNR